jgi:hypothetical protein
VGHAGIKTGFNTLSGRLASLGLTVSLMTNASNLPPDTHNEFKGRISLLPLGLSLFRELKLVADTDMENLGTFPATLGTIRRPSVS